MIIKNIIKTKRLVIALNVKKEILGWTGALTIKIKIFGHIASFQVKLDPPHGA